MLRKLFWLCVSPIILFILFNVYILGNIISWRALAPETTSFMRHQMRVLKTEDEEAVLQYKWVSYGDISINLKRALIASEDARFTQHEGFDWAGIQYAMKKNAQTGKVSAGGSTISQQLAKNLFLWEGKSYIRKAEEALITLMLEGNMSKERIFALYLNVIEWGHGVYGADAASEYHFDGKAKSLSAFQAARLAAMVTNPRYYDDHPKDRRLSNKTNIILRRLGSAQLPDEAQEKAIEQTQTKKSKRKKNRRKTN
ncbi:monofunctional biosynthetic peptidoglycan transglycosylase [Neisseria sp. Ec49-e6-T10]|uniref:monofunctional biosynthetic peptidoglycan transglycosylase n=1 Tax=Neisseria sp. Ec49-e6-T10 TaxID=3140744 RepID=UPI003EB70C18